MNEPTQYPDDFANAFESAFARLQVAVEEACARESEWPAKLAAAIEATLAFVLADPAAARTLTLAAPVHIPEGTRRYLRLIEHFAELLRVVAPQDRRRPTSTELALVGGLSTLIAEQLRAGRTERLWAMYPDLVEFALLPYLSAARAAVWARRCRCRPHPQHLPGIADSKLLRRIEFTEALGRLQGMIGTEVQIVLNLLGHLFDCGFHARLERSASAAVRTEVGPLQMSTVGPVAMSTPSPAVLEAIVAALVR